MTITQVQLNSGKAQILDDLFQRYPAVRGPAIRLAVRGYVTGSQVQRNVAMKLLCQAYLAIFGVSPIERHHFRKWLETEIQTGMDDPTPGGPADCVDAYDVVIS